MTSSTIPDPAPGQVWEARHGGSSRRKVRIEETWDDTAPVTPLTSWTCVVVAYPSHPEKVGERTYLSGTTLRTKWRFIPEEER